ncbi:MAG: response regulator transcription factor [Eubacteriales bacterium]|nr:response regulator transcription factor [Eubacteriales bacterium]
MKQILVLEDEENLNEGISTFLRKEGYHVLSAFSIREARALLDKKTDLIISDVTLPDGNAMEFWRKVRKTRETYLIYLTVLDKETDMLNGYDSGADDYITKPFSIRVLISKVHALMKRIEEKEPENLVSGNFVLKLGTMQVMRDGDYILLSKREFQILKLLMENAGRIVTKEMMLEMIWDSDGIFIDENTIAVNISRLKNKLGDNALDNIRGVGYIWTEPVTRS